MTPSCKLPLTICDEALSSFLELSPEIPDQARAALIGVEQPEQLTDLLAGNLGIDLATKQRILEETDLLRRMRTAQEALQRQLEIAELQQKLRKDVEGQFSDTQRRAYLREQLRAIQRELGEEEADGEEQADQLRKKLQDAGASESRSRCCRKGVETSEPYSKRKSGILRDCFLRGDVGGSPME